MDGLALLCNLFADGPVTLKRLRLARIAHLGELERTPPERLAEMLHASVPQARAFAEEARKLARRLAEEKPAAVIARPASAAAEPASPTPPSPMPARAVPAAGASPASAPSASLGAIPLVPGLFPGLDETLCARLAGQRVHSVQALGEFAGLALARRTGIPYATLLELARAARRHAAGARQRASAAPRREGSAGAAAGPRARPDEPVYVQQPFLASPRRAPAEAELASSDAFTLPRVEPESAGPFG